MNSSDAPYTELSPQTVLDAIEAVDYRCDGRVLALNSYENRVYQIGIEEGEPLVAKFYRPARWSDAAIREEHAFAGELAAQEIPVVAPLLSSVRTAATAAPHSSRCRCTFSPSAAKHIRAWRVLMLLRLPRR